VGGTVAGTTMWFGAGRDADAGIVPPLPLVSGSAPVPDGGATGPGRSSPGFPWLEVTAVVALWRGAVTIGAGGLGRLVGRVPALTLGAAGVLIVLGAVGGDMACASRALRAAASRARTLWAISVPAVEADGWKGATTCVATGGTGADCRGSGLERTAGGRGLGQVATR
jgi:hypothetical protein